MDMRRLSSALVKIQESIEIRREIYGDRHPRLAKCLYLKAEILFKNNQIESSQNHVEQVIQSYYHIINSPYYCQIIILSYHYFTLLLYCRIIVLWYHHIILRYYDIMIGIGN
jgi:hypothetical protein